MNFDLVLRQLLEGFDRLEIRYGLMGGFALGALGAPRATQDIDFLVHHEDLRKLHDLLTGCGYRRIHHSENVSQYEGDGPVWGFVDFIHALRPLALEMLSRAVDKPILSGARTIKVLTPEDVIGLKVQAIANQPKRRERETADIQALAAVHPALDWKRVEMCYGLFGLNEEFRRLKERFHAER